jgi:hypothetical protein
MAKKQVVSVDFKLPRQFLGIDGHAGERVYFGVVHDVPMEVVESPAFALYRKDETALILGEAKEEEVEEPEASEDLKGTVADVLKAAVDLSKDQLIDLKAREEEQQKRIGVINGLDKLIAAKG